MLIRNIHTEHIPHRAAHKISVLKRFLYFCISGTSEPGRPKAGCDGTALTAEALIGEAEFNLGSCMF